MNERAKEDDERRLREIAQGKINYRIRKMCFKKN